MLVSLLSINKYDCRFLRSMQCSLLHIPTFLKLSLNVTIIVLFYLLYWTYCWIHALNIKWLYVINCFELWLVWSIANWIMHSVNIMRDSGNFLLALPWRYGRFMWLHVWLKTLYGTAVRTVECRHIYTTASTAVRFVQCLIWGIGHSRKATQFRAYRVANGVEGVRTQGRRRVC